MARVKYYDHQSEQWKYADTAFGAKGDPGKTPEKGVDYFTEEDKQEMIGRLIDEGVLTYNEQELTEEQKAQARENIGIDQISFDKLTEDLDADGFRITNLPLPQSGSEPATKEFVESFTIEGSTYVATDDGEGNVTIRPYLADEDELVFKSHIQNQNNPHNVTAAQVGARPNNWMPTAEEVKARPDNWMPTAAEVGAATPEAVNAAKIEAVTEAKAYTNAQAKKAAPRNLLDNSDFRNPVNQRGFVSGTKLNMWQYFIDRWRSVDTEPTVTFNDNGMTSDTWVAQPIAVNIMGKRITVAVGKANGEVACNSALVSSSEGWNEYAATHLAGITAVVINGRDFYLSGVDIAWAALYEGEYTLDTLPEYQPKGYIEELAECLRYCVVTNWSYGAYTFTGYAANETTVCAVTKLPRPMIAIPHISDNSGDNWYIRCGGVGTYASSILDIWYVGNTGEFGIRFNAEGLPSGHACIITPYSGTNVIFSADL